MMVVYLPVKSESDWTNRTDVGHINLIGGLVTRNPPKNLLTSGSGGVPVEQPPQALDGKTPSQPKQHPTDKTG